MAAATSMSMAKATRRLETDATTPKTGGPIKLAA